VGKHVVYHHGRRRIVRRVRTVVIGTAPFSIAEITSTVVRVRLSRHARALVLRAGRHGFKVTVGGSGGSTRSLVLT
jgi:hypothetical protein